MATANLKIGQLIELNDKRVGYIRFIGDTQFAPGLWIGVEFDGPDGKNDGSVMGERYFECGPDHGMFLRDTGISRVLEEPKPPARAARPAPARARTAGSVDQGRPRPSSMNVEGTTRPRAGTRPSSLTMDARSPAPGSKIGSPTKRPASGSISRPPRPSVSGGASSAATAPNRRISNVAPSTSSSSKSTPSPAPSAATKGHVARPSLGGARVGLARAGSSDNSTTTAAKSRPSLSSGAGPAKRPSPPNQGSRTSSSPTVAPAAPSSASAQRAVSASVTQKDQEIQELQTRLRLMEQKRTEDREKLKILATIQEERDKFEAIIQKLQTKIQPLSQDNNELRKQLKDAEKGLEQVEAMQAEHDSIMEMATLDREMAEEQTEAYKADLEAAKGRLEELELENEILKAENQELGQETNQEERTSVSWLHMERENERLREALLRLRELTQSQEEELRDQIQSLEQDVQELSGAKEQLDDIKVKYAEAEAHIEDLRQQLDTALGAEDMIEELTEKNLHLNDYIEKLVVANEELETLKELNDELEVNHVENAKQLQEQLDFKDSLIAEYGRRVMQQDESISDQEYTIMRFRELVISLQSEMEDMRASKEISESEAHELNSRSRVMMDLNRQLQVSATNTKVKTIDMELRKLEAQEAAEHLSIVQLFLPEAFHSERESVLALLRFKRITFKAQLLANFIRTKVNTESSSGDEEIFEACDVLDKLVWVSAMCDRFVNTISGCSLDRFAKFEGTLYELEPVERALNGYIEGLKRDELKERQVAEELHRSIAVMSHLAETHLEDRVENYADHIIMRTLVMQSHLETTAAALSLVKADVQARIPASADEEDDSVERFTQKSELMIAQSRSAKVVVGKTLRAINDLKSRYLTLQSETFHAFEECEDLAEELSRYGRALGENLYQLMHQEERTEPVNISEVRSTMFKTAEIVFQTLESDLYTTFDAKLRQLNEKLGDLNNLTFDLDVTVEFDRTTAPWVLRSKELQDSKIVSIDTEEEVRRLKEDIHERATQLKLQEQRYEEATVKIELLESRTRDASKKAERIKELETKMDDAKAREKQLAEALETQVRDLAALETEKEKWKTEAEQAKAAEAASGPGRKGEVGEKTVATKREIDALRTDIRYLEAANRYLRNANRRELVTKVAAANSWLQAPLAPTPFSKATSSSGSKHTDMAKDSNNADDNHNAAFAAAAAAAAVAVKEQQQQQQQEPGGLPPKHKLALQELTRLPQTAKLVDLREQEGQDKLKWRPLKSTPQWQLSVQEVRKERAWELCGLRGKGVALLDDGLFESVAAAAAAAGAEPMTLWGMSAFAGGDVGVVG